MMQWKKTTDPANVALPGSGGLVQTTKSRTACLLDTELAVEKLGGRYSDGGHDDNSVGFDQIEACEGGEVGKEGARVRPGPWTTLSPPPHRGMVDACSIGDHGGYGIDTEERERRRKTTRGGSWAEPHYALEAQRSSKRLSFFSFLFYVSFI